MKFSKGTTVVLNSLSSINPSVLFPAGENVLRVMDPPKSMFARAVIKETVDDGMAIYDVPQFLSTLNMFGEYDLTPEVDYATITFPGNGSSMRYIFAHPSVVNAPEKDMQFPKHHIEFELTKEVLEAILKVSASTGLQDLCITPGGPDQVVLKVTNYEAGSTNESNNEWSITVPASIDEELGEFMILFYISSFSKMIKRNYTVKLSAAKIGSFEATKPETDVDKEYEITYVVAFALESQIEMPED